MIYSISFKTKWADFDANKHMRHTAYNDYAAECRISFFREHGLSAKFFESENFGPILFEESTSFRREIKMGESLKIDMVLKASSKHAERFKILHHVYKEDGTLAAKINVFIAWIDLVKRKLITPPISAIKMLDAVDRTDDFEEILLKNS